MNRTLCNDGDFGPIWSYIDFGDVLVRNGIFGIIAGSNPYYCVATEWFLVGLQSRIWCCEFPRSSILVPSFAVAPPSSEAVRKTERLM